MRPAARRPHRADDDAKAAVVELVELGNTWSTGVKVLDA